MMCLYIIIRIGLFPMFFIFGNSITKKHSFTITYICGLTLITLALVYALLGGPLFEQNPYYVLIAAMIVGMGEGFYWFSANNMNQIVSTPETRSAFFSYNGVFNNITGLLAPIYASFMLSISDSELNAYKKILLTIIIIFIVVIVIAAGQHKKADNAGSSMKKALSLKGDKVWRDHNIGVMFYGLRNGLELNTIGLLVYNAAKNGTTYSKLQIVFSLITIFGYRVIAKLLNRNNLDKTFKIGVLLKIISVSFLTFMPNTIGAICYGIINALSTVFYDNSYNIISGNIISRYQGEMTARVVARETYLSLSRCIAMSFVIMCYKLLPANVYAQFAVMFLSLACVGCEVIFNRYSK